MPAAVYQGETVTEEAARLMLEPNFGVVATLRGDGSPHQTVTWVDWDGEHVLFNTAQDRAKERHLQIDPRASVLVLDTESPHRWVSIAGRAELTTEGAVEHAHKLARKYTGRDFDIPPGQVRMIVRIRPDQVTTYGLG
jgi:PPOX class probable F420-dependent enzyme